MLRSCSRVVSIGLVLAAALPAASLAADPDGPAPDTPDAYVTPRSAPAAFNPLQAMWGLRQLGADTRLADLDEAVVLYLDERATFVTGATRGTVYLAGGRQLVPAAALGEVEHADQLLAHPCLCALEYDAAAPGPSLDIAAGAYRAAAAPAAALDATGVMRFELELASEGQTGRVTLRRLVCWSEGTPTVDTITATLPRFMKLADKQHAGFADPPVDDRPVRAGEPRRAGNDQPRLVADESDGLDGGRPWYLRGGETFDPRSGRRPWYLQGSTPFGARDPLRTTRPGMVAFVREVATGDRLTIDYGDYYPRGFDTWSRDLDRRQGIYFRDPYAFP